MATTPIAAAARIGLGTVQFGLDYGISNTAGQVTAEEVDRIVSVAKARGIKTIDTAAVYGRAEEVLAGALDARTNWRVITKTARLAGGLDAVVARARRSAALLGTAGLDTILVHSAADLAGSDGQALWRALTALKDDGLFARIGISAYISDDPENLARQFRPDVMQVPMSLLDQRLVTAGALERLAASGVEVHVRSIFLQGLLFVAPQDLASSLIHIEPQLRRVADMLSEAAVTPLQAAVGFALSRPGVHRVLCGVTSAKELEGIAQAADEGCPDLPWPAFALNDPVALDPSRWNLTRR